MAINMSTDSVEYRLVITKRNPWTLFLTKTHRAKAIWWPWHKRVSIYWPHVGFDDSSRLAQHEIIHVRQWLHYGRLAFIKRYLTSKGRLELEAPCFAHSVLWYLDQKIFEWHTLEGTLISAFDFFVNSLATGYKLKGVTRDEVARKIKYYMNRRGQYVPDKDV